MNYGLAEGEQVIANSLQNMSSVPTEFAPSNVVPSDAQYVYGPAEIGSAAEPGLIENPPASQPPLNPSGNGLVGRQSQSGLECGTTSASGDAADAVPVGSAQCRRRTCIPVNR